MKDNNCLHFRRQIGDKDRRAGWTRVGDRALRQGRQAPITQGYLARGGAIARFGRLDGIRDKRSVGIGSFCRYRYSHGLAIAQPPRQISQKIKSGVIRLKQETSLASTSLCTATSTQSSKLQGTRRQVEVAVSRGGCKHSSASDSTAKHGPGARNRCSPPGETNLTIQPINLTQETN